MTRRYLGISDASFFSDQREKIKLPKNFEEVKDMGKVLSLYTDEYYFTVMLGYSAAYVLYDHSLLCHN